MKTRNELIKEIQQYFKDHNYEKRAYNDEKITVDTKLEPLSFEEKFIRELFDRIVWHEREIETVKGYIKKLLILLNKKESK